MYVHINHRKTIAFYKLFWMTQKWRLLEAKGERNFTFHVPNLSHCLHVQVSFQNATIFNLDFQWSPKFKLKHCTHSEISRCCEKSVQMNNLSKHFGDKKSSRNLNYDNWDTKFSFPFDSSNPQIYVVKKLWIEPLKMA